MLLRTLSILTALSLSTVLAFQGSPSAQAATPQASADPMAFQPRQLAAAQISHDLMSSGRYAYAPQPATPQAARRVFEQYIDSLDPQRLLLTQAQVDALDPGPEALVKAMEGRDLSVARAIYEGYQEAALDRLAHARKLLAKGFDFTRQESWLVRDKKARRPATLRESDDLWRQYVKNDWLRLRLAGQADADIVRTLDKRYERMGQDIHRADAELVSSLFVNAYAALLDPHTSYLAPVAAETFNMNMSLSLEGIGAILQFNDDTVVVRDLVAGGPAARSGKLAVGDRILAVGQGVDGPMVDVVGWRLEEVVGLIRGKRGSTVRLSLSSGQSAPPRLVALVRDKIKLEDQQASGQVVERDGRRVGVITLPGFYLDFSALAAGTGNARSASRDVARLLEGFKEQGVDAVLVDLRGNGGGSLTEAVALTGLFIDVGPVVQVRKASGPAEVHGDTDPGVAWAGPLAVLVDASSASASEIFAAAIQDHGRGLVIGETTYGKGTVQTLVDLDEAVGIDGVDLGQVKLTIAQFFRISGATTQRDGVHPDIAMPMTLDGDKGGEAAFDNALEPGRIDALKAQAGPAWASVLPEIKARHRQRLEDVAPLRWWLEDVADHRAQRDARSVSLNQAARQAERDRLKDLARRRDDRRRALGLPVPAHRLDDGLNATERSIARQVELEAQAKAAASADPLLAEAVAIVADGLSLDPAALSLAMGEPAD